MPFNKSTWVGYARLLEGMPGYARLCQAVPGRGYVAAATAMLFAWLKKERDRSSSSCPLILKPKARLPFFIRNR
jgi:hypothetical protein